MTVKLKPGPRLPVAPAAQEAPDYGPRSRRRVPLAVGVLPESLDVVPRPAKSLAEMVERLERAYVGTQRRAQEAHEAADVASAELLSAEAYGIGRCLLTAGVTVAQLIELDKLV